MRFMITICWLSFCGVAAMAAERGLRVTTSSNLLPPMRGIAVVKAGAPGPNAAKYQATVVVDLYKQTAKVPAEGPYDVWWLPKNGLAVRLAAGIKLADGEVKELKVEDYLGVVNVRGDGQPRAGQITIAPQDDPGPDEKEHVAIQTAKDFRVDMVAPDGFYSLWITADNGARPRKVNDRFRVLAGKVVQLD